MSVGGFGEGNDGELEERMECRCGGVEEVGDDLSGEERCGVVWWCWWGRGVGSGGDLGWVVEENERMQLESVDELHGVERIATLTYARRSQR